MNALTGVREAEDVAFLISPARCGGPRAQMLMNSSASFDLAVGIRSEDGAPVATGKYVDTLLEVFGGRLLFPAEVVGRGDMSRGGLLLRHARSGVPLAYTPVAGAVRRGKRPSTLEPVRLTRRSQGSDDTR